MFDWLMAWRSRKKQSGAERRTATRHPVTTKMNDRLMVSMGHSSWPVIVRDISESGIGLVVGLRHEPGQVVPIDLFCSNNQYSRTLEAEVVRLIRTADGYWLTGLAFKEPLELDELKKLL